MESSVFENIYLKIWLLLVSEYPKLPKPPEIRTVRKYNHTANGTDDYIGFSLRCKFPTAKERNVKYAIMWVINGIARGIMPFSSFEADTTEYESVLSDDDLKSFQKIDQVSEIFLTTSTI